MKKLVYSARALSNDQLIDLLISQGMRVDDRERALNVLQNISYSRFKSYLIPLMVDRRSHRFRYGATFEEAYALYGFDRRFRELIFHELEKVEISLRTHIAYATAGAENGYWYTNPDYFADKKEHNVLLKHIKSELDRSDDDAIRHFYEKYSNDFPPCWMALEATSMGTLSMIFDQMSPGKPKRAIASYYGISDTVMISWMRHIVYIRNTCAHHARLWNRTLAVQAVLPHTTAKPFADLSGLSHPERNIYFTLCIIKYFQNTVKPTNTFAQRLQSLLDHFPIVDRRAMGFPDDWEYDPFWGLKDPAEKPEQKIL